MPEVESLKYTTRNEDGRIIVESSDGQIFDVGTFEEVKQAADALHERKKLIAIEEVNRPRADANDRVGGLETRREGVDALFSVHHIDRGDRQARGDGHFLHNIENFQFLGIAGASVDAPSTQHLCNHMPAFGEDGGFVEAANGHKREDEDRHAAEEARIKDQIGGLLS